MHLQSPSSNDPGGWQIFWRKTELGNLWETNFDQQGKSIHTNEILHHYLTSNNNAFASHLPYNRLHTFAVGASLDQHEYHTIAFRRFARPPQQ